MARRKAARGLRLLLAVALAGPSLGDCATGLAPGTPALSCAHALAACGHANARLWLAPPANAIAAPYEALCADAGWVLALRVDGSAGTFAYSSAAWTSPALLNEGCSTRPVRRRPSWHPMSTRPAPRCAS